MAATATKKRVTVGDFTIEADHPRNMDLLLQCAPGVKLRTRIAANKPVIDAKTGEKHLPPDQATALGRLPEIPGQLLVLHPAECVFEVIDPLFENEELCELLTKRLEQTQLLRVNNTLKGTPPRKEKLDIHRFKSLVREAMWLVNAKEAKVTDGVCPELDDIEDLPGHFLLNPGSHVPNSQPRFEKDLDKWVEKLNHGS